MADLNAVSTLAKRILELNEPIHFLVLNAGVMQAAVRKSFLDPSASKVF